MRGILKLFPGECKIKPAEKLLAKNYFNHSSPHGYEKQIGRGKTTWHSQNNFYKYQKILMLEYSNSCHTEKLYMSNLSYREGFRKFYQSKKLLRQTLRCKFPRFFYEIKTDRPTGSNESFTFNNIQKKILEKYFFTFNVRPSRPPGNFLLLRFRWVDFFKLS